MKTVIAMLCIIFTLEATAQTPVEKFSKFIESKEKVRRELWDKKEYIPAIGIMKESYAEYLRLDSLTRQSFAGVANNLFYNMSCAYSLSNQRDSAVAYLRAAVEQGYTNYGGTLRDTDFDNIRNDREFQKILEQLREIGDFEHVLAKYPAYDSVNYAMPAFTYQPAQELRAFKVKYNLDSVAAQGNEASQIINLMRWAHRIVKHDGNSSNPLDKSADALINICRKENRGVNCRMMATILNEAYLAKGFASRFVTCMPRGEKFDDCHVITMVYSKDLKKWLWMDPTFESYITDEKGNFLSIEEVRRKLIQGDSMVVAASLNWNGNPYGGGAEQYLHVYMAKNLFRFSCPLRSVSGFESLQGNRTYVDLYPLGYNPTSVIIGKGQVQKNGTTFYTTNAGQFWEKPEGKE